MNALRASIWVATAALLTAGPVEAMMTPETLWVAWRPSQWALGLLVTGFVLIPLVMLAVVRWRARVGTGTTPGLALLGDVEYSLETAQSLAAGDIDAAVAVLRAWLRSTDEGPNQSASNVLLALGEKIAGEIIGRMPASDVVRVSQTMATSLGVPRAALRASLREFVEGFKNLSGLGCNGATYTASILSHVLGDNEARALMSRIVPDGGRRGVEVLDYMEAGAVAEFARNEHPQIVAAVLACLERRQGAAVLAHLHPDRRADLVLRIARLRTLQPRALKEMVAIVTEFASTHPAAPMACFEGESIAGEILDEAPGRLSAATLLDVSETDEELAARLEGLRLSLKDLARLDDAGIQALTREMASESLILALVGADDRVRERFVNHMPRRVSERMREWGEGNTDARSGELDQAQSELLSIAKRLAEEGHIHFRVGAFAS